MSNPFFYGGMIREARFFVGREAELRTIFGRLQHLPGQAQHVSVTGPRRIGKSSLLEQVRQRAAAHLPSEVQVVYVDGQACETPQAFYLHFLRGLGWEGPPSGTDLKEALERLLWQRYRDGGAVVLLLDELEHLVEQGFDRDFFDGLRSWMNRSWLAVVTASRLAVADLALEQGLTSSFFNLFGLQVPLGPLTEAEAETLLARNTAHPFTPAEAAWLKDWARVGRGYHPARLQMAAFSLYEAKARGERPDLDALAQRVEATWETFVEKKPVYRRRRLRRLARRLEALWERLGRLVLDPLPWVKSEAVARSTFRLVGFWVFWLVLILALWVVLALLGRWPLAPLEEFLCRLGL